MLFTLLLGVVFGMVFAWTWFPGTGPAAFQPMRDSLRALPKTLGLTK